MNTFRISNQRAHLLGRLTSRALGRALGSALPLFIGLLFLSQPAQAGKRVTARVGNQQLISQEVRSDLYTAGDLVVVEAPVRGDVAAAGFDVRLSERVEGDAMLAGHSLEMGGVLSGDLRAAGRLVEVRGEVGGHAMLAGQYIRLNSGATVQGELYANGKDIFIDGIVNSDLWLRGRRIHLGPNAQIQGNVNYTSPMEAEIDAQAQIAGEMRHEVGPQRGAFWRWHGPQGGMGYHWGWSGAGRGIPWLWTLFLWINLSVFGILFLWIAPGMVRQLGTNMSQQVWWASLLRGLAMLVVPPLLGVLFAITVIGAFSAVWVFFFYGMLLWIATPIAALLIAKILLDGLRPQSGPVWHGFVMTLALLVLLLVTKLPWVGFPLYVLALAYALGNLWPEMTRRYGAFERPGEYSRT